MKTLFELIDLSKQHFANFVDMFLSGMGIMGTFFNAIFMKKLSLEEASELSLLDQLKSKNKKTSYAGFSGYIEIKKHGSKSRLILTVVHRFTEKVDSYVRITKQNGKPVLRRVSSNIYHVFVMRFDLEHLLYVFSYGIYNPSLSKLDPYRPIKDIYQLLDFYGLVEYERSERGFLRIVRNDLDTFFNSLGSALIV